MYAVIKTGGKQYIANEGETLKVEKIEASIGDSIEIEEVLMLANNDDVKIGAPFVEGAKVKAEIVSQGKAKKINVLKFKRRKQYLKRMGHRQLFTELKIVSING